MLPTVTSEMLYLMFIVAGVRNYIISPVLRSVCLVYRLGKPGFVLCADIADLYSAPSKLLLGLVESDKTAVDLAFFQR